MKFVEHKLATGAMLTGYLRDETTEMPSYNTRPAVLILPGGGYRYCSPREADPVAVQFFAGRLSCVHPDLFHRPRPAAVAAADPKPRPPSCTCAGMRRTCALRRIRSPSLAFLPVPTWRLPPPCCGMQLPCSRLLVLPEPKPAPMRWCWGTPLSPAASLPTAALLRTCAARMKPCCRP